MRSWSILVGRLFGVEVRLHLTFFLLPLFIFWTEYGAQRSANGGRDLALVGIILASVGAHEVGHILASRRVGMIPKAVILLPLSGVTLFEEPRKDKAKAGVVLWKREIQLALVGPLVNLALALVSAGFVMAFAPWVELWQWPFLQAGNLARSLVWANLYLAGLNLLPAYPLDGGRILRALFSRSMDSAAATRRAVSISNALAMVLIVAGLFSNTWLTMARIVRGQVLSLRTRIFVYASQTLGATHAHIIWKHILPNVFGVVIVYLTLTFSR